LRKIGGDNVHQPGAGIIANHVERDARFLSDGEGAENQAPSFVWIIFQDSAPARQGLQEVVFIEAFSIM
jgi:hypothetical protein